MSKGLRRVFWIGAIGGVGYAGWTFWNGRRASPAEPAPDWPPLDPPTSETIASAVPTADAPVGDRPPTDSVSAPAAGFASLPTDDAPAAPTAARWVEPVDGECPDGYPIKANDNSGIYHVPDGRFYDRTVPERCYASADDAAADGYRAAKA